jgi:hypothetical protein
MQAQPVSLTPRRIGFHYFPDTTHYRESDLRKWGPELRALGASWLVLKAPANRAIPEVFIEGLLANDINPILHFQLPLTLTPPVEEISLLFETYRHWGVEHAVLLDRPNRRRTWIESDWAQSDLVERFVDIFLPLASAAIQAGLTPILSPLEPGGDYWDTAFLRTALDALQRRGGQALVQHMALSAYAWPDNLPLDWGAGGPERWPGARPYTSGGEQDQRGFRIFDWYLAISQAILGFRPPVHLLGTGCQIGAQREPSLPPVDETAHTEGNLEIYRKLAGLDEPEDTPEDTPDGIPDEVISGCFWLLAADDGSPHLAHAWFKPDGGRMPIVERLQSFLADPTTGAVSVKSATGQANPPGVRRPIAHYLLLPSYDWGVADWHIEAARTYIKQYRPTVGFSLAEAAQSTLVSVLGGDEEISEDVLDELRTAGCKVERITSNGMSIAS